MGAGSPGLEVPVAVTHAVWVLGNKAKTLQEQCVLLTVVPSPQLSKLRTFGYQHHTERIQFGEFNFRSLDKECSTYSTFCICRIKDKSTYKV